MSNDNSAAERLRQDAEAAVLLEAGSKVLAHLLTENEQLKANIAELQKALAEARAELVWLARQLAEARGENSCK
jgi:uncharacterized protein involved in exopolysaccharide biosynthesis